MKNRKIRYFAATAVLLASLFTGCAEDKKEEEAAYRQIGINCMEEGDYEGAVAAFNSALRQCVGSVSADEIDICYYKAAAQYAGGDVAAAMETYNAIIDYDNKAADAYYLRGCFLLKQGDFERGKADFANAVKYNPDDYKLYINIFENLSSYGMTEDGKNYLNQAFDIKGNDVVNLESRGQIYYLLGQYDNAVAELSSALEEGSTEANLYLARSYEAMGDAVNAETYYQAYIASGSVDSIALNALGEIMLNKGNYAEAVAYLEQGLEQENVTNRRSLLKNLIIAYEYNGNFTGAWEIIQEYVGLYPEDEDAQREYVFLKNRQQQEPAAEETEMTEESSEPTEGTEGGQ